jgi:hypothetical protein
MLESSNSSSRNSTNKSIPLRTISWNNLAVFLVNYAVNTSMYIVRMFSSKKKWRSEKRAYCLSWRRLTRVIGMQVNYGLEISMNDANYLYFHDIYRSELIHCANINSCHPDLFSSQSELKVIGHHTVCPTQVRRPWKRYFKVCNYKSLIIAPWI